MSNPKTVDEYREYAVRQYIKTAVYVDDNLFVSNLPSAPNEFDDIKDISDRKIIDAKSKAKDNSFSSTTITQNLNYSDDTHNHCTEIINGFAKEQIMCSLYQPEDIELNEELTKVAHFCGEADIIILDWKLREKERVVGRSTKNIITEILNHAINGVPQQLKLIMVHTIERNLQKVFNELNRSLNSQFKNNKIISNSNSFTIDVNMCRIKIYRKPSKGFIKKSSRILSYNKLAEKSVEEFTEMVPGVLQASTLVGLSYIKKNYNKIISKFNQQLDRGFFTNIALTGSIIDTNSHVIPLLTSEFEAVLEDSLQKNSIVPLIPNEVFFDWIDNEWIPRTQICKELKKDQHGMKAIGKESMKSGFKSAAKKFHISKNAIMKFSENIFLENENDEDNYKYAHLLSSRTAYEKIPKTLKLGTIVFNRVTKKYLICLQPLCDSVRINKKRNFIFAELSEGFIKGNNSTSLVALTLEDKFIDLNFTPKSFKSVLIEFKSENKDTIVTIMDKRLKKPYFNSTTRGKKYFWIDQLKTANAQRAAELFSREISRVGLTESEWLRLTSSK